MKIYSLFNLFRKKKKGKLDINNQVERLAKLFIEENRNVFPELDYSLKSLTFVDEILRNNPLSEEDHLKDKYCYKCEKLAAYILQILKNNYSGDVLWEDNKHLIFIFDNYKEFNSYKYVRKQRLNSSNVDTVKFLNNLSK